MPARWPDLAVIVLYLLAITWFGATFRNSQRTLKDYFLGGRTAPWWAIALSIVSAETSTLTVIGTPGIAFNGNFGFLQVVFGYLLARIVISTLFLPAYFRGELFTAYELMNVRFGPRIRKLTAGTFLILRALAEGVRVFAISIVISIVLGTGEMTSIIVILMLTLLYTYEGGMTAVIWTDVVQMVLYIAGAAFSLYALLGQIPGGWAHVVATAAPLGKFQILDFEIGPNFFSRTYSFWGGVIGGTFLTTASHGTEQLIVQRLLSAGSERQSRVALLSSWVVIATQFTLFLIVGVCLFTLYRDHNWQAPTVTDSIYPRFIWEQLPAGLSGLVIAAILAAAMSNLSAALNSLASTTIMDLLRPLYRNRPDIPESVWLARARWATVGWGAILIGVAFLARNWGGVLEAGLGIASIIYGSLLGVFLLGLLTRRADETGAMIGMLTGLVVTLYVRFFTSVAWTWYILLGTAATFLAGWLCSRGPLHKPAGSPR
jgi:SSS family transporter